MYKNKKITLKRQNERLSQELNNEKKTIGQLKNSLEVMHSGWTLDKEKLAEAVEKLKKLKIYLNKYNHNEEINTEKSKLRGGKVQLKGELAKISVKNGKIQTRSISKFQQNKKMDKKKISDIVLSEKKKKHIVSINKHNIDSSSSKTGLPYGVDDESDYEVMNKDEYSDNNRSNTGSDCGMSKELSDHVPCREIDENMMSCPLCCNESFSTQESLKYHLLSIFENVFCPVCTRRYDDIMSLIAHLETVCNGKPKYESDPEDLYENIYKQALAAKSEELVFTLPQKTLAIVSFKAPDNCTNPHEGLDSISIVPGDDESPTAVINIVDPMSGNFQSTDNQQQSQISHDMNGISILPDENESPTAVVNIADQIFGIFQSTDNQQQSQSSRNIMNSNHFLSDNVELPQVDITLDHTSGNLIPYVVNNAEQTEWSDRVLGDTSISITRDSESNYNLGADISLSDKRKPTEDEYVCSVCDIAFTSISDHIMQYHSGEEVEVQNPPKDFKKDLPHFKIISVDKQQQIIERNEIQLDNNLSNERIIKSDQTIDEIISDQLEEYLILRKDEQSRKSLNDNRIMYITPVTGYWIRSKLFYKFVNNEEKMKLLDPSFVGPVVTIETSVTKNENRDVYLKGKLRLWCDKLNLIQIVEDKDLAYYYKRSLGEINVYIIDKDILINKNNLGSVAKVISRFPRSDRFSRFENNVMKQIMGCDPTSDDKGLKIDIKNQFIGLLEVQLGSDQEVTIENIDFKRLPYMPASIVPFIDNVKEPLIPLLKHAKMIKWRCVFCLTTTSTIKCAMNHKCYACEYCGKGLPKVLRVVRDHFVQEHPHENLNFSWKNQRLEHKIQNKGGEIELETIVINMIENTEEIPTNLKKKKYVTKPIDDPNSEFPCVDCNMFFSSKEAYDKHVSSKQHTELIHCKICDKTVPVAEQELHLKWHEDNQYTCGICNKTCATEILYLIHKETHDATFLHEEQQVCHICHMVFNNKTLFKSHLLQHDGRNRPYSCQYCSKRFRLRSVKDVHERIHNNKMPLACKECGKCFRKAYSLHLHLQRHSGNRRFNCDTCSKAFFTKGALKAHLTIHSSDKPFKCPYCGKRFKTLGVLISHKKQHVRPFKCPFCPLDYSSLSGVRVHITLHEPGMQAFHCVYCSGLFRRKYHLDLHTKTVHGIDPNNVVIQEVNVETKVEVEDTNENSEESS